MEKIFPDLFTHKFYYSVQLDCDLDHKGIKFHLLGMFDPLSDDAAQIGHDIISRWEGADFYGTPLHFESAKAIVYYISATIGKMQNHFLIRHAWLTTSHKYNSFHEANRTLDEIWNNFEPTNAKIILPLMQKIFGDTEIAKMALQTSNALEIRFLPTILYSEHLKIFPSAVGVGTGEMFKMCKVESRDTCL